MATIVPLDVIRDEQGVRVYFKYQLTAEEGSDRWHSWNFQLSANDTNPKKTILQRMAERVRSEEDELNGAVPDLSAYLGNTYTLEQIETAAASA